MPGKAIFDNFQLIGSGSPPPPPPNQAPIARPGGPYTGTTGQSIQFNGSTSSDPEDGTVASYQWNFGDGTTGTGATPTRAYTAAGTYTVTLTVTDTGGLTNSATTTATVSAPATTPATPSNLTATSTTAKRAQLNWRDNSDNEQNFLIERSTSATSGFTQITTVGVNVTTYTNTGLTSGRTYYFRVRAGNASGNSAYSNTVSIVVR
ncbi:MAG TPA: PKD domain-containing protein [Pyrinomonadaceae bacterium]